MRKIIALLIAILTVVSLASCADGDYPPQKSTEEEARVVMSVKIENKTYEVK